MANRIVLMHRGSVQQVGSPAEIYASPANTFVATFVGSPPMNLFNGRIEHKDGRVMFLGPFEIAVPGSFAPGPATLGIRPEHAEVLGAEDRAGFPALVEAVERVGPDSYLRTRSVDRGAVTVRVDGATGTREGERIALRFPTRHLHLFDAAGDRLAMKGEM